MEHSLRTATTQDLDPIYKLGKKVELTSDVEEMNQQGFLMGDFTSYEPEIKHFWRKDLNNNRFLVYETDQ